MIRKPTYTVTTGVRKLTEQEAADLSCTDHPCDRCGLLIDTDGPDLIGVDTDYPHFNLVGHYCQVCADEVVAEHTCAQCGKYRYGIVDDDGECWPCQEATL